MCGMPLALQLSILKSHTGPPGFGSRFWLLTPDDRYRRPRGDTRDSRTDGGPMINAGSLSEFLILGL